MTKTHRHRRGEKQDPTNPDWDGWVRYPCTDQNCDWAVYIDRHGQEWPGYIPTKDRPGNTIEPPKNKNPHYPQRGSRIQRIDGRLVNTATGEVL